MMTSLVRVYGPAQLYAVEPGNKVMLRSGGPEMTVCSSDGVAPAGTALCAWQTDNGELQFHTFKISTLTCFGAR